MSADIRDTLECLFIVVGLVIFLGLITIKCSDDSKQKNEIRFEIQKLEHQKSIEEEKQKTEQLKIQQFYECLRIEKDSMMCSYE